jgi:catechol 2,3-dioxygenase-like lactoylglutathione lyase family enzyme
VEVRGIRWVGVRTDRLSEMRAFATDVLGLRVAGEDTAAPDGHVYELAADPSASR